MSYLHRNVDVILTTHGIRKSWSRPNHVDIFLPICGEDIRLIENTCGNMCLSWIDWSGLLHARVG
jgi:hypothetical protein